MLGVGINVVSADYNRRTVIVHHLTDDISGQPLPICGADITDLSNDGDATGLLEDIRLGKEKLFSDESSRMCGRCCRIYLRPGTDEEKSVQRLNRWKKRQAREEQLKTYKKLIIARHLNLCPTCDSTITPQPPEGYDDAEGVCTVCNVTWSFSVLPKPTGEFAIWAHEEEKFRWRVNGNIQNPQVKLEWLPW